MRDLLLANVLLFEFGMALLVRKVKAGRDITLSLHALASKKTAIAFGLLLTFFALFLQIFNIWFAEHYQPSLLYSVLFSLGLLFMLFVAWVPDRAGPRRKVHRMAASGIVFIMPTLIALLIDSSVISTPARILAGVALGVMIAIFCTFYLLPKAKNYFLIYESSYIALFFSVLVIIVYI